MSEATGARWKIERAAELLDPTEVHAPAGRLERVWALLDGALEDVDALERRAFFVPRVPRFLRRDRRQRG